MEKKAIRGYIITFVVAVTLAVLLGGAFGNVSENERQGWGAEKWQTEPRQQDGDYYFTFTLPESGTEGNTLAFQSAHFECEVLIGGKVVYSLKAADPSVNKSTGYCWNFIRLNREDAGQELVVHMISVYRGQMPQSTYYYGNEYDITKNIFRTNGLRFFLALLILTIGVVLFIYSCFVTAREHMDESLVHFSVFSILLACWSIMESPISALFSGWGVGKMVIDHYALMLMPVPFMLFLCYLFSGENHPVWKLDIWFNGVVIAIRTLLQVTTLYDLKQTLWMTQLSFVVAVVVGSVMGIRELRISRVTRQMRLNLICIFGIFAAAILELVLFRVFGKSNIFGMLGFVVYVCVLSVEMVRKSRKMVERAQETELYRKLAYTDELTGAYNRTAFQHDLDSQISVDEETGRTVVKENTVFVFDLNDLKKCNDNFGHDNGDKYIKMVADMLLHVFGIDGRCYRIGGDEFCVIMPGGNQNEIDHKLISVVRNVQELDRKGFVVPVGVAVGYAVFNPEYDATLEDTVKRADVLMYQNKQVIKKNRQ